MITRNIIISQLPEYAGLNTKEIRGIVTLSGDNTIKGCLKVYNVDKSSLPLTMAIKIGEQKFVFPKIDEPEDYNFSFLVDAVPKDITVLLASTQNNSVQAVALGVGAGSKADFADLFNQICPEEIDEIIDNELSTSGMDLSAKISSNDNQESTFIPKAEDFDIPNETGSFYSLIQPQLDELFAKFPHFKEFEDIVQNTEWIKVHYANGGENHYIIGKLFDGEEVTHLCYGIPAQSHSVAPPTALTEFCQWIPTNLNEPEGAGYWVMYQNAQTGENIRL